PKILQSDNGSEYTNDVIKALIKLVGIDHRLISPYNPRADGKVERSIRTVMSVIKKLLHGTNKYWPLFVSFAQLTFNNKVSSLTGSTPFSLMFGRTLNDIIDYTESDSPKPISLEDWKEHQQKIVSLIYPAISEKIKSGKDAMVKTLNKNRKQLLSAYSFPIGSTVMIIDVNRQNKWEPKYVGPYTIVRRSYGGAYVLKDSEGDLLDRKVTADQMKLISKSKRQLDIDRPAHVIEKILAHRGTPDKYEYYVHWLHFPEDERSWVPAEDFMDHKIIQEYWKNVEIQASISEDDIVDESD
ncbi:MAG TPA: hypothetical protein VHA52_08840, partial [Candidatus Babeliaceae bacterium]|nr:hypothetical protein [Candidatus Babeliaceae bacterium]